MESILKNLSNSFAGGGHSALRKPKAIGNVPAFPASMLVS